MKQIKTLEKVLGDGYKYGREPIVREKTWFNEYIEYVKHQNFSLTSIFIGGIRPFFNTEVAAFYYPRTHVILKPTKKQGYQSYFLYHELGEGYISKNYQDFSNNKAEAGKRLFTSIGRGKTTLKDVEKAFIHRLLSEGVSEYLAVECINLEVKEGKRKVGADKREFELITFGEILKRKGAPRPRSLVFEQAAVMDEIINGLVNRILELNKKPTMKRTFDYINLHKNAFQKIVYTVGYYLVKSSGEAQPELAKGKIIDDLLKNPPETLDDLYGTIMFNMDIIASKNNKE